MQKYDGMSTCFGCSCWSNSTASLPPETSTSVKRTSQVSFGYEQVVLCTHDSSHERHLEIRPALKHSIV